MQSDFWQLLTFVLFGAAAVYYALLGMKVYRIAPKQKLNRLFLWLMVAFFIWAAGDMLIYSQTEAHRLWLFYKISSFGWCFFPAAVLHFAYQLTREKPESTKHRLFLLVYLLSATFWIKNLTGRLLIQGFEPAVWGWKLISDNASFWSYAYQMYYILSLVAMMALLIHWKVKSPNRRSKRQADLIIYTGLIAMTLSIGQDVIKLYFHKEWLPGVGSLASMIWFWGIGRAVSHYQLMDLAPELALRQILSKAHDLIFLTSPEGLVRFVNSRSFEMLGYTERELINTPLERLFLIPDDCQKREKLLLLYPLQERYFESNLCGKNDQPIHVGIYASSIPDPIGESMGFVWIIQDRRALSALHQEILERRRIQADLQKVLSELKSRNDLLDHELRFAQKLQQQYLPVKPPNQKSAFFFKPTEKISGDFFDFIFFENDQKIGVFISDVSGHGIAAAMITAMMKGLLNQIGELKHSPSDTMAFLNEQLMPQISGHFITALYGILDNETHTFTYSLAGHMPPLLLTHLQVEPLEPEFKSPPLGLIHSNDLELMGKNYRNNVFPLPASGKLVLYTDGVTECPHSENETRIFEDEGWLPSLLKYEHLNPAHLVLNVYQELAEFHGGDSFEDDICLLCLEF